MYKRWFEFVCVFGLVVLFPMTLVSIVPNPDHDVTPASTVSRIEESKLEEIVAPTVEITKEIKVTVLDGDCVEEMELETYILHVVLGEMPASFELEALKAQAVVARTYTMRRQDGNTKHKQAAVCTDSSCCQAYKTPVAYITAGGQVSDIEKVKRAVTETQGKVLTYNGELIEATYFSCSGGLTEDAAAVWGKEIPYLQATPSPGEENAKYYVDTVYFSTQTFEELLGWDIAGSPSTWFGGITYTNGQGVDTIQIGGKTYKGTQLRQLLDLRSTAFIITAIGDTIVVTTKGFGHRVGMSQYGADAMAVNGSDYRQILAHYYKDTSLVSIID